MKNISTLRTRTTAILLLAVFAADADGPLRIEAVGGGVIDLNGLSGIYPRAGESVEIIAQGTGSRIELPSLTHFFAQDGSTGSFVQADDGGVIRLNDTLTTFAGDVDLRLTATGVTEIGGLELGPGASLSGSGTLAASVTNSGIIRPGGAAAAGQVVLQGNFQQNAGGRLEVELGGDVPATGYDRLVVQGQSSIDGSLAVFPLDGFTPVFGTIFEILTSTGLTGIFPSVSGLDWPGGGTLTLDYSGTGVLLSASTGPFPNNSAPVLQFIPDLTVEEGQQVSFIVESSDPDGTIPVLSATPLPVSASFVDQGDGTGVFDWTPTIGQAGIYEITFTASDGTLSTLQVATITVVSPTIVDYLIDLGQGFNLFAYPMEVAPEHGTCIGLLSAIGTSDEVESIARFDATTGLYQSCTHADGVDFPIAAGAAYVVQMNVDKSVRFTGTQVCPTVDLVVGPNLIGHPAPAEDLGCYSFLDYLGNGTVSAIQQFDPITGAFQTCTWLDVDATPVSAGEDFAIVVGQGLLVHMHVAVTIPLPGCQ